MAVSLRVYDDVDRQIRKFRCQSRDDGQSRISIPDYAIAFADEMEDGEAFRRRITVAY